MAHLKLKQMVKIRQKISNDYLLQMKYFIFRLQIVKMVLPIRLRHDGSYSRFR